MSNSVIATNGPFLVGYTLCFGLMGALVVQAYIYFTRFTDDRRAIKTFVTVVLLLETLMTGSVFGGLWVSFSQNSLNLSPSMLVDAFFFAPMTGLVTTLTHGFFCWRIASLRKFHLLPLPIMMVIYRICWVADNSRILSCTLRFPYFNLPASYILLWLMTFSLQILPIIHPPNPHTSSPLGSWPGSEVVSCVI